MVLHLSSPQESMNEVEVSIKTNFPKPDWCSIPGSIAVCSGLSLKSVLFCVGGRSNGSSLSSEDNGIG